MTAKQKGNPWEPAIVEFEQQDKKTPPPKRPIVFAGSSTFTLWASTLTTDFAPLPVLCRGFGGSQMADVLHYVGRVILHYKPRAVVLYSGDNDIACGKKAEEVAADFRGIVTTVRATLPQSRFYLCCIKPSPSRWTLWPEMAKANDLMRQVAKATWAVRYIDTAAPMLGPDGLPRRELFLEDMLHMNPTSYALWTRILKPILATDFRLGR